MFQKKLNKTKFKSSKTAGSEIDRKFILKFQGLCKQQLFITKTLVHKKDLFARHLTLMALSYFMVCSFNYQNASIIHNRDNIFEHHNIRYII